MLGSSSKEVGEILRRIRKEKGLRLEDISDENISPATVSNIERGVPHVLPAKIGYLMDKLQVDTDDLRVRMSGVEKELGFLELKLTSIEALLDQGNHVEAEKKLVEFDGVSVDHPLTPQICYIRGRLYVKKKQWLKAEKELLNAIRLSEQNYNNIDVDAYNELGLISYYRNDLQAAIQYVNNGLEKYNPDGKRDHTFDVLVVNKISYLEKLNRIGEAFFILNDVWERKEEIKKPELLLHLYHLKVVLLRKTGYCVEALEVGLEGIQRGRLTTEYNRILHLWDALGSVYLRMNDLNSADVCLTHALSLEELISSKNYFVSTLTKKGILHMKKNEEKISEQYLQKAIAIGKEHHADVYLLDAFAFMGDLQSSLERHGDAVAFYRQALSIADKLDFKQKKHSILFRIIQSLQKTDSEELLTEIENMIEVQKEIKEDPLFNEII
ncbi:helix-turn-helix domain-containing protein [Mechercharimyces sp. CAU 1602]|uniref:helix-turn-helix domain-containing protein n=1 Tax=Mechercharimyces sp. CAU 1602 TaxID=2973933 RepID=UPI0021628715|nr:helix-turn-helix domain-containing protein [Mechercharimyces sp. CAU 1602]MCS1352341.1 hypothetical protein [Mechercharimyces sp. CAU 1602]